jgi:hypothetical protein
MKEKNQIALRPTVVRRGDVMVDVKRSNVPPFYLRSSRLNAS